VTRPRLAAIAGAVVLAGLAFQAGEYGTVDWLKLRRQVIQERRAVRDLEVELDSLSRLARALETDPADSQRRDSLPVGTPGGHPVDAAPLSGGGAGVQRPPIPSAKLTASTDSLLLPLPSCEPSTR